MKFLYLFLALGLICCKQQQEEITIETTATPETEAVVVPKTSVADTIVPPKVYSNNRFKDVTVEKTAANQYLIKGKAQIFEANFSWVIEDGHNEIQKGHQMTDAGAPEWGNFKFSVEAQKERENSTLHLILFEISAKDGSRQYELPILLE